MGFPDQPPPSTPGIMAAWWKGHWPWRQTTGRWQPGGKVTGHGDGRLEDDGAVERPMAMATDAREMMARWKRPLAVATNAREIAAWWKGHWL